jgi:EmrB/QacA subfamily drug resistance transporter
MTSQERRRWLALVVVCLAQLMIVLDTTIVNVALPRIQSDLHFSQASLTWVINGFLVTFGSFLLLAGRLGDLIGRKRVFMAGVALFTLASVLCGAADSSAVLVGARFLQGIGAAMQASVILAIIVTEFPEPGDRARAMSAYVFTAVAGGSIGLLAGGVLTQLLNWHWIFFVNVPIGVGTIIAGRALIPNDSGLGVSQGIDWLGSILVTLSIGSAVYAIIGATNYGWGSPHVILPAIVAAALMAAFLQLESRIENPIMPLRIFRLRALMGASVARGFLVTGMFGVWFLGSLYLERVLGYGPVKTGLAFMPWTLTVLFLSLGTTRRLVARFGPMPVMITGMLSVAVGMLILRTGGLHTSYFPGVMVGMLLMGFGIGNAFMPMLTIAMADVPPRDAGLASGIVNVSQQVAGALGLALLSTFATNHTHALTAAHVGPDAALVGGYQLAYLIGAGSVLAAIVIAFVTLRAPRAALVAVPDEDAVDDQVLALERELDFVG